MFRKRNDKYTLNYTANTDIPNGLVAYIRMVVQRNPRMWAFFVLTDIVHALRYPISFYCSGKIIDILTNTDASAGIPQEAWVYTALIFTVLLVGELAHAIPHYMFFDWWKRARAELRSDLFAYTLKHSFTYFESAILSMRLLKCCYMFAKKLLKSFICANCWQTFAKNC